jgi:predicted nucleic acid-binding protein
MIYYAVIDTNVLVSAMLKWNSNPGNILELAFGGTIIPLLNESIVSEYRKVLARPKFHLTQEIIDSVVGELERLGLRIDAEKRKRQTSRYLKPRAVAAFAATAQCFPVICARGVQGRHASIAPPFFRCSKIKFK